MMRREEPRRYDVYMVMEGRRYLNVKQTCNLLGIARATFYKRGYGSQLQAHSFKGYSRMFYALDDVLALKSKM
jgi:hypothetical protein